MENTLYRRDPKSINRKYREYFLPAVLNVMAGNLASIVDSMIAGNMLGQEALGAIGLLSPVIQLYAAMTTMLGVGVTASVSKAKGENSAEKANRLYTCGIAAAALLCVIFMAVQLPLVDAISGLLAGKAGLAQPLREYYLPFILATPLQIFTGLSAFVLRTDGRPKFSANLIIISNSVNLVMDIVYMGLLKTGIAGSAVATATGQLAALCILSSHFIKKKNTLHFDASVFKKIRELLSALRELISTGFSSALGQLLLVVKLQFMMSLLQGLAGSAGVIAFSVYKNALLIISMFISGGSQAMIPIVGMCMGERDFDGIRYTFRQAVRILLAAAVVISALVFAFAGQLTALFGVNDPEVAGICISALRITAVSFIGVAFSFLMLYYYTAAGKKSLSVTISAMNTVGFVIPSALALSAMFGINGLWASFIVSEALTLIMIFVMKTVIIKRSNGQYTDIFMVPEKDENTVMSLSFKASEQNAAGVSEYIMNVLNDQKTAIAVEDITAKLASELGGGILIDVRIITGEEKLIAIRYNGRAYNPLLEESDDIASAVNVIKSLSHNIEYSSVLGFNRIMIEMN